MSDEEELTKLRELLAPFRTDESSSIEILEKIIRVMRGLADPTQEGK